MNKKLFLLVVISVLSLWGVSFAAGQTIKRKGVSRPPTVSEEMMEASGSGPSTDAAVNKQSTPKASLRRAELQRTATRLVAFSQKAAAELRREVANINQQKDKRIHEPGINAALEMVSKYDTYARSMQQNKGALAHAGQDIEKAHQKIVDLTHRLQFEVQEAMNEQSRLTKALSNIMKNQHDTLKAIIQNMKG